MIHGTKTIGAYEAKTHLSSLLKLVAKGREIIITRRERPVARLIPAKPSTDQTEVFARMRALRSRLSLPKGETARDLIDAGRRL
jgi:prevent-host-death family protein